MIRSQGVSPSVLSFFFLFFFLKGSVLSLGRKRWETGNQEGRGQGWAHRRTKPDELGWGPCKGTDERRHEAHEVDYTRSRRGAYPNYQALSWSITELCLHRSAGIISKWELLLTKVMFSYLSSRVFLRQESCPCITEFFTPLFRTRTFIFFPACSETSKRSRQKEKTQSSSIMKQTFIDLAKYPFWSYPLEHITLLS